MRKFEKIALVVGGILLALGLITTISVFAANSFSLAKVYDLSERVYHKELDEEIKTISIDTAEADLRVLPSENEKNEIIINDTNKIYHEIEAVGSDLRVTRKNTFYPFSYLVPINDFKMDICLYLNHDSIDSLYIKNVAGRVDINGFKIGSLNVDTVSGAVRVNDVKAKALDIVTVSSNVDLLRTTADSLFLKGVSGSFSFNDLFTATARISLVSGSIDAKAYDADKLSIDTVSGNINIIFLTPKEIDFVTISGRYDIPDSIKGSGQAKIRTTSGNVYIHINQVIEE